MTIYPTSDSILLRATFRDYAVPPAVGALLDPDTLEVNTYTASKALIDNVADGDPEIVRVSLGVFTYEWELPSEDGTYYIEFAGVIDDHPAVIRKKVKIKWKPSDS